MWVPFFLLEILSKRIYGKCHHQRLGRVQSYGAGLSNVAMGSVAVTGERRKATTQFTPRKRLCTDYLIKIDVGSWGMCSRFMTAARDVRK